ncbi:glycosyltransferase family 4 protein [Halorubrum ezzemoulense]|uniref:glycosyltransferase family 4 protein n=1 Tax=Halorubrum TaxID=56688 RepID=UPI0010F8E5FD|nr:MULTISPECIES: glycosyltransferase family 4 protein [Halorubrum]MDB2253508.1 glycosyltransferase family 4 protein [Halorubrum ezzemoulense]TKX63963.1 glycosyltransferase family 1 protein [Halorubrum sp. GN12_10-3_MGM]
MTDVLYLVNSISSTSIPVEIASAINEHTCSNVTVGVLMEGSDDILDPDVQEMELPIVCFGGTGNFDPVPYQRLRDHIHDQKYDIIHPHHNFTGSIGRIIGRSHQIPVVNTEHNDVQYFSLAQRLVNAATFWLPQVNVYNSESTLSSLGPVERWLSNRNKVIYNGINIERISESRYHELPVDLPDKLLITNVGVMTEQKNQRNILRAARQMKQRSAVDNVHFVISSSGPLEKELRDLASQLKISDIITFTGYLPEREQIYSLLHQSDIFLTPSVYEGFCVAAVEAMGCGLPVIASDIDVFHEVIGEHGIFVPHDDPDAIATQLIETSSEIDSKQIQTKREKLRQRAVSKYSLTQTAIKYHELYQEVST